jgi:hypothetical protein
VNENSSCSAVGMRSPNSFTAGGVDEGALCHRRGSLIGVIGVIGVIGFGSDNRRDSNYHRTRDSKRVKAVI